MKDTNDYLSEDTHISFSEQLNVYQAPVHTEEEKIIQELANSPDNTNFKDLDRSVLLSIIASRRAIEGYHSPDKIAINIGSSRGATTLFEQSHAQHLEDKFIPITTSPTTTLGNISSWVGQDIKSSGLRMSHSITCSSSFHGILNGIAWINAGMSEAVLAGGTEACITPYTIHQMKNMRILSRQEHSYPSRPLDLDKNSNTMVLGEGACSLLLEPIKTSKKPLAFINGIGIGNETITHHTSISSEGKCLERSMEMALKNYKKEEIDVIITHSPGTVKGDLAEMNAINTVFDGAIPCLTNNKWKIGHTFATSGVMSIEMALFMMDTQKFISLPYISDSKRPKRIKNILLNSVGFGGNAVSILLSKP